MEKPIESGELAPRDERLIKRLKLGLWGVVLILILHALPGHYMMEAWPIVRWAMFSNSTTTLAKKEEKKTIESALIVK
jgi:hypothetical protein